MPVQERRGFRVRSTSLVALLLAVLISGACARTLPVSTDDASITARVRTVLMNDPEVGANQINVSTTGGVVVMTGRVDSAGDADRAAQLARGVQGVRDVQIALEVEAPGQ